MVCVQSRRKTRNLQLGVVAACDTFRTGLDVDDTLGSYVE